MNAPHATTQAPALAPTQRPALADDRVARFVALFEHLTPGHLPQLGEFYAEQARFIDPFNDVTGLAGIRAVFEHMFRTVDMPRFVVREVVQDGDRCFLTWDFHLRLRGRPECVHGGSLLHFDAQGRVRLHRDYWDAAGELYEKLPLLGSLMRWLKRRASS